MNSPLLLGTALMASESSGMSRKEIVAEKVANFGPGDVLSTVVSGLLVVFCVLSIIFLFMVALEKIFDPSKKKSGTVYSVVSPLNGIVKCIMSDKTKLAKGEVVLHLETNGIVDEIITPYPGKLTLAVKEGDTVKNGDVLFSVM
ncbi:MAG: hypothetical protein RSD39_02755 [Oscillospiraceae bacterium]